MDFNQWQESVFNIVFHSLNAVLFNSDYTLESMYTTASKSLPQADTLNSNLKYKKEGSYILWVFHKQPCYEIFGQEAGVAEEFLIKRVVHGRHVGQSLLLVVTQERRGPTQTEG